jgi:signal transduction histidine kinase
MRGHRKIATDLHDTVLQPIVSLVVSLEAMEPRVPAEEIQSTLVVWKALAREALAALRAVLTESQVHPHVQIGLLTALEQHLRPHLQRNGIRLSIQTQGSAPELPVEWLSQLYLIVREAATNVEKHAHATVMTLELIFRAAGMSISMADNGTGFTLPDGEAPPPSWNGSGWGLRCMRERTAGLGGALSLTSALGEGTQVLVEVPYPQRTQQGSMRVEQAGIVLPVSQLVAAPHAAPEA